MLARFQRLSFLSAVLSLHGVARAEAGDAANALPGIVHVPVAGAIARTGVGAAFNAGYGFTGSAVADSDTHQRLFGGLAASVRPLHWLSMSLQLDARYDWHRGVDERGGGWTGDPRLYVRAGQDLANGFKVGAQLGLWAPGRTAPSITPSALSPELRLLATYAQADSPFTLATQVGFRLDNSVNASPSNVDRLAKSDRLVLGASDANELLLGIGASRTMSDRLEAVGEWTWDMRVPSRGAPLLASAMRFDAGARFTPTSNGAIQLQLIAEVSPSERLAQDPGSPVVFAEPTAKIMFGLNYRPSLPAAAIAPAAPTTPTAPAAPTAPAPSNEPAVDAPPEEALPAGQIRGVVHSFSGKSVPARVRVDPVGKEIVVGSDGAFELDVPPGEYDVTIAAPGFRAQHRHVKVEELGVVLLNVDLVAQ